jgi:hypothetical protein
MRTRPAASFVDLTIIHSLANLSTSDASFMIAFGLAEATMVDHFVARHEELSRIHKVLGEGAGRRTAVVHGLGGMGKTQLAAAYAMRHQESFSAVFWLNARDETTLKRGFMNAAERILREHPPVDYIRDALQSGNPDEVTHTVRRWLDSPQNDRWLMIFDNYDNPLLAEESADEGNEDLDQGTDADEDTNASSKGLDIRSFLPNTHHGAILITTRSARVRIGCLIPLGKLGRIEDSLDILSHASHREGLHESTHPTQTKIEAYETKHGA